MRLFAILAMVTYIGIVHGFKKAGKESRMFPIFEIVTFQNDGCQATSSNANNGGTCYTAVECQKLGGTSVGSCASGFGVCCIVSLQCGQMSSQNQTYLVMPNQSISLPLSCSYKICPLSRNICRIRLDFTSFNIAGPQTGNTAQYNSTMVNGIDAGAIGDCVNDTFTLTSPGSSAPPIICGYNSGQHIYVDASMDCHMADFSLGPGGAAATVRQWNIKVTQYACGNIKGGPLGCIQYFTGNSGTVASFNFPTNLATVPSTTTHLSSQHYTICFRQEQNMCAICYTTVISTSTGYNNQASFGLSVSSDVVNTNNVLDAQCSLDFLSISNAQDGSTLMIGTYVVGFQRICGRAFSTYSNSSLAASVCTQRTPFRLGFNTDANEVTASDMANGNEEASFPGGIIGFNLNWRQISC